MELKKIVIISSGQPSLNPRLVKEADSLTKAGLEVVVLYAYWNGWGTRHDQQLLTGKKWKAIRLGGDPEQKRITWYLSRLIHKISILILQKTGNYKYLAEAAIARSSYFLIKGAKKYKADLYIAHNLGALPATAKTAAFYKKPYGFDAEDFHRQEVNDDICSPHFKICSYLEDKYLPPANYLTASSPLIAGRYAALYKRTVTVLLNVFPKKPTLSIAYNENKPLKLFWFSQTIGPNRGLEMIIEAIGLTKAPIELHLLGQPSDGYQQNLVDLVQAARINEKSIFFYEPVNADEIFYLGSQFDIGLASETGFCLNNNIALSNKIFTYIQSGLAVAASNTPAQSGLLEQYPKTGKIYNNANELSVILKGFHGNRDLLYQTKKEAFKIGQDQLNWENESQKFLRIIENVLTAPHPKMKNNPSSKWFYGVDSIRFVLAFIVMLSHFNNVYATALKHSSNLLLKYAGFLVSNAFDGIAAVIAFFIISGFVIHYPNKNGIPNLKEFWIRRFLRILIPLSVILIIGDRFNHPEKTVVWSLVCELIYYALYPFLSMIRLSWENKFLIAYAIAALVICSLAYHDIVAFLNQTNRNFERSYRPGGGYFTWIIGLPCWLLGVLIAEKIDDLKPVTFMSVMIYRLLVYIISCFCLIGEFHLHLSYVLSMNIFALLLYKWIQTEIVYFKNHRPNLLLERMGKFSYSLYLCHPLLYAILGLFITISPATYPVFILLIIMFSYFFYLLVEKPGHKLARLINNKYNLAS